MKKVFATMLMMVATQVQADGFVCQADQGSLAVKVYNHTSAAAGTRNAAVLVVSDPSLAYGNKTIAKFTSVNETLKQSGAYYIADVDLRFNDSGRKGELIAGTNLGHVDTISLWVNHSFQAPVAAGTEMRGTMTVAKRNGQQVRIPMTCVRYLKGE